MASQGGAEAPVNPTSVPVGAAEPASSPVEMNTVPSTGPEQAGDKAGTSQPPSQAPPADASASPPPPTDVPITRTESQAQAGAEAATSPSSHASGPTLSITLQLVTGARHPYKIDEKYLNSRKVEAKAADGSFDPRELSGYKLKELIWTDWRTEWEPKPASPGSIRLIRGGKFIQDNKPLSDYNVSFDESNFIQMTVKPADITEDDEAAGGKTGKGSSIRQRDGEDTGAGCRCVIL